MHRTDVLREALRRRVRRHPRRGELAGEGLLLGRRHPAVHHLRDGVLADRRRRQPLRRPGVLVGADDPRPRPPRRRRGSTARRRRWPVVRRADAVGDRTGHRDHRPRGPGGAAPHGQLRHRGHHERDPAGPRLHRPRQDHQVLRLLPRPQRRAAGRRRLGCRHSGPAVIARGHRRRHRRHDRVAVQQRSPRSKRYSDGSATRSPASSPRPAPATWAPSRRCPATTPRCAASPPTTARC